MSNSYSDFLNNLLESYNLLLDKMIEKSALQTNKIIELQFSSYIDSMNRLIKSHNTVAESIESIIRENVDSISLAAKRSIQDDLEKVIKASVVNRKEFLDSYVDEIISYAANNVVDQLENIKSDEIEENITEQNPNPIKKHSRWTRSDILGLMTFILTLIMYVFPVNDPDVIIENLEVNIEKSDDNIGDIIENPSNKLIESVSSLIKIIDDKDPELLNHQINEEEKSDQEHID